jgi:tetratricopeptide (TPR) repeat protein
MRHAAVFAQQNDMKASARLLADAVKDFAAAPGKNYEILTHAYKTLGNTYIALTSYVQAADAFSKALHFSEGDRLKANLGFLLGDAYQKGNILPKAREAFAQVADTYDSVWARLAQQRLSTLDLAQTVSNS